MSTAWLCQIDAFARVGGAATTIRLASHDDDRLCHLNAQTWWPAIARLPTLAYDFFDGAFGGEIVTPSGRAELSIEAVPGFAALMLHGARIRWYSGTLGQAWGDYVLRFDGLIDNHPAIRDGVAAIDFRVDDRWLDDPILATYAGTTGAEGEAAQKGQVKPLLLGAPRFVEGVLIDTIDTIVQLNDGAIAGVDVAFESVARFAASAGDYASFAALDAATIAPGFYATCLAGGYVRHGAPPDGVLTYHVQGSNAGGDGGGQVRRAGAMIKRIAARLGHSAKVDATGLTAIDSARPWDLSVPLTSQTTLRELAQALAQSINAVALVTWTGLLTMLPIDPPEGATPVGTLASDGTALPPVARVDQLGIAPPWWRTAIEAEVTHRVHGYDEVRFTANLVEVGIYDGGTTYREGNIASIADGSRWLYTSATPTAGNAPSDASAYWERWSQAVAGPPGADGAPGAPGADGVTYYTWYAYADAPDGTFNFTTGNPGNRVYQGIATGKTTPTESANPADYVWSQYVGPPNFGIAAFNANTVVAGAKLIKVAGGDTWNGSVHSTESYKDGASVSFIVDNAAQAFMVGLNTDPTTDASYVSLDYAIYLTGGTVEVYESGTARGSFGSYTAGDIFAITYNGKEVAYSVRSTSGAFGVFRTVPAPAGLNLFFDSSMLNQGYTYGRILSFTAAGTAGNDGAPGAPGTDGAPGAPGAPGVTYYTWYAYADAPDGSFNFTTGSPGTRVYQGVATGKTTATESSDPADYVWSPYVGPPNFGLTALNSNAIVAGNKLIKVAGGSSWNASIHSTESYKGGATVSFVVDTGPHSFMVGLNTDPTTDADYTSIDFAIYIAGTTLQIYESGGMSHNLPGFVALNDRFAVTYNGKSVTYSKNGVIFYTSLIPVPDDLTLFLDTTMLTSGVQFGKILAFTAVGPAGVDGAPGDDGADALDLAAAPASLVIPTSAIGVVTSGALPKTVQMTARLGATDVTGAATWPAAVVDSCVVTNLGGGAYRVDDITADTASFEVTVTHASRSTKRKVTLAKAKAGSDAQQARAISIGTPTGSWATASGSALSLNLFPGTTVTLSLSAGYTATSPGSTRVMARLMYRNVTDGGAWTQAGADIVGSYASNSGGDEPVMTPGSCSDSRGVTAPGSPKAYEFRVDWIADGAASLSMTGTAFQVSIT